MEKASLNKFPHLTTLKNLKYKHTSAFFQAATCENFFQPLAFWQVILKGMSIEMKKYYGTPVCGGTADGVVYSYSRVGGKPDTVTITDVSSEQSRFLLAKYIAVKELSLLYEKAYAELGESAAMIFYIHQLMLDDETFRDFLETVINECEIEKVPFSFPKTCSVITRTFEDKTCYFIFNYGKDKALITLNKEYRTLNGEKINEISLDALGYICIEE